jgi:hypothetical protein
MGMAGDNFVPKVTAGPHAIKFDKGKTLRRVLSHFPSNTVDNQ